MFVGLNIATSRTIWTLKRIASVESLARGEKMVSKLEQEVQVIGVRGQMRAQWFPVNVITERPWTGLKDEFMEWKIKGKMSYLGVDTVCDGPRTNKKLAHGCIKYFTDRIASGMRSGMGNKRISTHVGLSWTGETVGGHVIVLMTLHMVKEERLLEVSTAHGHMHHSRVHRPT